MSWLATGTLNTASFFSENTWFSMTSFITELIGPHYSKDQNIYPTAKTWESRDHINCWCDTNDLFWKYIKAENRTLRVMNCLGYHGPSQAWESHSQKLQRTTETLASAPHRHPIGMMTGDWKRGHNDIGI